MSVVGQFCAVGKTCSCIRNYRYGTQFSKITLQLVAGKSEKVEKKAADVISGDMLDEFKRKNSNMAQEIKFATFPVRNQISCLLIRLPTMQAR